MPVNAARGAVVYVGATPMQIHHAAARETEPDSAPMSGRSLLFIVVLATLIAVVLVYSIAQRRWNSDTLQLRQQLLDDGSSRGPRRPQPLDALPPPVARYLRAVTRDDETAPQRVRVRWRGEFNLGDPGADRWVPFGAEQDFVPGAPGFVWDARIRMAPGLTVNVRDAFVAGTGSMRGRLLGLYPVVDREGDGDFAASALQRYLGEAIWLPAALRDPAVRWTAIDARRAAASISAGGATATLEFRFDDNGLVASVWAAQRSFDDGKAPPSRHPWQARVLQWGEVNGARVPVDAVVEWLLPSGPYAYWRGRPVAIAAEPAQASTLPPGATTNRHPPADGNRR